VNKPDEQYVENPHVFIYGDQISYENKCLWCGISVISVLTMANVLNNTKELFGLPLTKNSVDVHYPCLNTIERTIHEIIT